VELDEFPLAFADGVSPFPALAELRTDDREQWQGHFAGAVELIEWAVPELGGPLSRGMRSVIPIAVTRDGASLATQTDAFGAAAMILPDSDASMAAALLHEFQHSKLAALSELVPLVADDTTDLYSPWRTEPRPASAVLHGAFAHAAVALLWSRLAARWQGGPAAQAWTEAELARAQTLLACADLAACDRLSPAGLRFVSLLHRCTRHLAAAPSPGARRQAQDRLAAHRSDWNRRQRRMPPGDCRTAACAETEAVQ
jgi:HEXXH motif-containing protein